MADTAPSERVDPGITGATVADELASGSTGGQVGSMTVMDAIVADTQAALVQSSSTEARVVGNLVAAESITKELGNLQVQAAKDRRTIVATEQAAELNKQKYVLSAANAAGVDPRKASDFMIDQISKFTESAKRLDVATADYRKKKDSSLLDDPVQWVQDLVAMPAANRAVIRATQDQERAARNIQGANAVISQVASTSMQIKESTTAASAEAASNLAASEQLQAAQRTALEGLKYNTAGVQAAMEATKERLALNYNLKNSQMQQKNQEIVLDKFAQERKEWDWRVQEKNATTQAKEEGKDVDAFVLERINTGRAARGLDPITGTAAKASIQLFKSGASKEMAMDYQNGEQTIASGVPMLGATPADAIRNVQNSTVKIAPARERLMGILKQAQEALAANPMLAGSKDQDAKDAFVNKFVQDQIMLQYSSGGKDSGNMFNVGDLSSVFGMSAVAALPVTQKFLMPASKSGVKLEDPKVVFDLAIAAVNKGQISSNDFQDLATVYQMANDLNLRASNPFGFGISLPNGGRNYFYKPSSFGKAIDITNPTELGRYMNEVMARELMNNQDRTQSLMSP